MSIETGYYLSYLVISISLTVWVDHTLKRNGRRFLLDAFGGDAEMSASVHRLLTVGFYLINIGYIVATVSTSYFPRSFREVLNMESTKLGIQALILGVVHLFNLFLFAKMRERRQVQSSAAA